MAPKQEVPDREDCSYWAQGEREHECKGYDNKSEVKMIAREKTPTTRRSNIARAKELESHFIKPPSLVEFHSFRKFCNSSSTLPHQNSPLREHSPTPPL